MITFWYWICLLYLLSNINILIDESYDTIYRIIDKNKSIQYLNCFNLSEIIINKTRINTNEIKNEFNYHLRWIQKNKKYNYDESILNEKIEKIMNQTKSRDYLIYKNEFCFIFYNKIDFGSFYYLLSNLPIYPNYFVFNNETFSFLKLKYYSSEYNQLSIQHKDYPYSGCSKDYSNFRCLNNKIKRIQPLSKYYFRSDDNESIELNYQINQTIIDNEFKVIKQCNQIDCNINLLYPDDESESITLEPVLCISKLDFYLQLIGLIVLFLNISIFQLSIKLINSIDLRPLKIKFLNLKFIKLKLKKIKKILNKLKLRFKRLKFFKYSIKLIRKYLKMNNLILLILLIFLVILFSRSIYKFIEERDYPFNKTISVNSFKPELSIVICVIINLIKGNDYNIHNKSLSELERETDNFLNIVLKDIYLEFLNKQIPIKWQLESELILFKYVYEIPSRCYQIKIFLNQPRYQTIFSVTKLIIEFHKGKSGFIYILADNEIFNSNSYQYSPFYYFRKRILERSKLNKIKKCKDYDQIEDCKSKWNCIDQCTNREILNQFKNLTGYEKILIIDKNHCTDKEWSNLFIKKPSSSDKKICSNISKECENKYSELNSCQDIKFEKHPEINYKFSNKRKIDFNYEVIIYKEEEPSLIKLLFDLLNIQSIFFNLNVLKFLLVFLFKFKLNTELIKILKFSIYLICYAGLILHFWFIFVVIIDRELIDNQFYEIINTIQPPDLIFCFDFNQAKLINPNHKLTYQYLDKITSDQLREDLIFDTIEYRNQFNKWIKLNNETNFKDDNLKMEIFYYWNRKCFRIVQKNIEYNRNQFEFDDKMNKDDDLVLKIFFNRSHLKDNFYYFTKTKNKIRFSKIQILNLEDNEKNNSFKIRYEIIKSDEFNLIKNPLSFNDEEDLGDSDVLFKKLLDHFVELNLVTFELPFEKNDSNLNYELDDNLFVQLYYDMEKKLNQTNLNLNFQRQYAINYVENLSKIPEFDLGFSINFVQKVIIITNMISSAKLIINLLNALSLWFNLCIFDLHTYLYLNKIRLAFMYLYKLLTKFSKKTYFRIIYDDWY